MANLMERAGLWMAQQIAGYLQTPRERVFKMVQDYYAGDHPSQLKVKAGQDNDNVTLNFLGLAVDRSISMLVGDNVEFAYPEGSEAMEEYIDQVWDANKRGITLHEMSLDGAVFGTPFVKIVPDGVRDPYTEATFPRLVTLDPKLMTVDTSPFDKSLVLQYVMQFKVSQNGKERMYREVTRRSSDDDFEGEDGRDTWVIETFEFTNGWSLINKQEWAYDFPPIIHWKNLPSIHSVYGMSDIEQVINIQDKYNFVQSNNLKINRYHAHPKTWAAGLTKTDKSSWGADEMILASSPDAKINNLEMSSDLASSRNIASDMRQGLFDVARQVDISNVSDKLGQLTNFGLRLLYSDALSKTQTKRQLYGDAFTEINRRLLVLAGVVPVPCEIRWGDALPMNIIEELEIDEKALSMGIVDEQTVSEKYVKRYGVDWETIQQRKQEKQGAESNLGAVLLRKFNQGQ